MVNAGIKSPVFTLGWLCSHFFGGQMFEKKDTGAGIKVYANIHDAKFKDGDHVHLEWREDRIASDTHEGTLSNVKRL
jgi:hypothetical protein